MRSIQSGKVSWSVPGNRGAFLSPRRAHLLTTAPIGGSGGTCRWQAVRSTRWMRLLREPMDNATLPWEVWHCPRSWRLLYKGASANRLRKPTTGSFAAAMGIAAAMPIFCSTKRNKNENEGTVRTNGDLSFGSKGHQPRRRTLCLRCFRLPELFQNHERLRWCPA